MRVNTHIHNEEREREQQHHWPTTQGTTQHSPVSPRHGLRLHSAPAALKSSLHPSWSMFRHTPTMDANKKDKNLSRLSTVSLLLAGPRPNNHTIRWRCKQRRQKSLAFQRPRQNRKRTGTRSFPDKHVRSFRGLYTSATMNSSSISMGHEERTVNPELENRERNEQKNTKETQTRQHHHHHHHWHHR